LLKSAAEIIDSCYYDTNGAGRYWVKNAQAEWIQTGESGIKRHLAAAGSRINKTPLP